MLALRQGEHNLTKYPAVDMRLLFLFSGTARQSQSRSPGRLTMTSYVRRDRPRLFTARTGCLEGSRRLLGPVGAYRACRYPHNVHDITYDT